MSNGFLTPNVGFLMIHLSDKMPNADSHLVNVLIVVKVNFFRLERADESFSIPVLPRTPATGAGNRNAIAGEGRDIGNP